MSGGRRPPDGPGASSHGLLVHPYRSIDIHTRFPAAAVHMTRSGARAFRNMTPSEVKAGPARVEDRGGAS
ncbi:hypothetical protein B005_5198 [Nocardiopsis alba ATCC BAA-2165]|uniref:Uncharacterized protein n=1 Tax=Nocardiopsis alba (strain ATCC BAA-2165 / BE74) TaxID=1205910 RepID=J7LAW1_NOCAA|nr:hypothetical protein B005_5198 [Nocardiopsis alba ATCC BAA-2165]